MSNYLPSNKVKVFPFGNERIHDPLSRTLNESNIARLVRFLAGNRDYVLNYNKEVNIVDFVLNGYTFSIDLSDNELYVDNNTKDIYAAITISGYDNGYPLLDGNDNGVFNFEVTEQGQAVEVSRGLSVTTITSPTQFTYHFKDENALQYRCQQNDGTFSNPEYEYSSESNMSPVFTIYPVSIESQESDEYVATRVEFSTGKYTGEEFEPTSNITENTFTGLEIISAPNNSFYNLHLLTRDSITNLWKIPDTTGYTFEEIYCGTSTVLTD